MPDKTRFDTKTVQFVNKGVSQRLEPGSLAEGQYVWMRNVTSIQEGTLEVRPADKRVIAMPGGRSSPNIFARLRVGSNEANNRMYVGEGTDILRFDGDFSYIDWANSAPLLTDPLKERWTAVRFNAGATGTPYIYIAAPLQMLRDKSGAVGGLQPWGLFPPTAPVKAVPGSTTTKTIANAVVQSILEGGDNQEVAIALANADLSRFSASVGSGLEQAGYESEDFVTVTFDLNDVYGIADLRVQFDTSTGGETNYTNYYDYSVMATKEFLAYANTPPEAATNVTPKVRIRKSAFEEYGLAGEGGSTGHNWRNIKRARLLVKITEGRTCAVGLKGIALEGGAGPDNNKPGATPYRWVYTFRDPETGQESNPCAEMVDELGVVVERDPIALTLAGTDQVNAPSGTAGTIAIYRAGGNTGDALYRLIGYATNPGAGLTVTYTDAASDADIASANQLETDNDAPVTSQLPKPVVVSSATPCAAGLSTEVTVVGSLAGVTPGSRMWLRDLETGTAEQVRVSAKTNTTVTIYCQYPHSGGGGGFTLTCYAASGVPCSYAAQAGDCIYLAGDANNPHILYRSRRGKPDCFPAKNQLPVGSPSNPIQNITEFNGEVVVFNLTSVYVVRSWTGDMMPPLETPAQRGLLTPWAWCKGDNELYYLAYDGIYSWAGGQSRKISEQIDWMFKSRTIGGIAPIDLLGDNKRYIQFEYFRNRLRVIYRSTDGKTRRLYYDAQADRWELGDSDQESPGGYCDLAMFTDRERGRMFVGKYKAAGGVIDEADQFAISGGNYGATDGFSAVDGLNGTAITYGFRTGPFHLGMPAVEKLFSDIVLEVESEEQFTVGLYYDFSDTVDPADTFTIPGGSGRRRVALPLQQAGDPIVSSGKQAYAVAFQISGTATKRVRFHSLTFTYAPVAIVQRGKATDWEDLGYAHDKRLEQLVLEYDLRDLNNPGTSLERTVDLDILYGVNGNTPQLAVASFTLGGTGTGRTKVTLPISSELEGFSGDKIVCKMVRLRPRLAAAVESVLFEILDYDFIFDKHPPDITYFTEPSDLGYDYDKYFEQLNLEVDTGGEPADVEIYLDSGGSPVQTLTVTTTRFDRNRTLTLAPGLKGNMAHLLFKPGAGADMASWKFQLYSQNFTWEKADKGPVFHTVDWDDLGHPHDKRLYSVSLEYEVSVETVVNLSFLCGLTGSQEERGPYALTLETGGRKRATFAFPDTDTDAGGTYPFICKAVRFQPASTNVLFKAWKASFDFEKYPQDVVRVTDYQDFGSPYDKYFQQLILRCATGGVNASVTLEVDGADPFTIGTVNSTDPTRDIIYTLPAGTKGRRARLRATPGASGKFQLWEWTCITAPADKGPVLHTNDWDDLGYPHDKRLKAVTIQYEVTQNVNMNLYFLQGFGAAQAPNPVPVGIPLHTGGRKIETYRLDGQIAKAMRFQPASTNTLFKSWSYKFEYDELPPDYVSETKWEDYGYPYEKILQQLAIEMDTGGQPCDIDVVTDMDTPGVQTTLQVTTTDGDLVRLLTFPVSGHAVPIEAKRFKLVFRPAASGKAQLYSYYMHWLRANPGPVEHSSAWDSVEHPYDKRFSEVTIEYDTNGTPNVDVALDTITGIKGDVITTGVTTFRLTGSGHGLQTFAIQPEIIAKMVKLRPVTIPITNFRMWKYQFVKNNFPPDIVAATEWSDLGWPYEKILKVLTLDVDTGGVAATVEIQADGVTVKTLSVTTTTENRAFVATMASDIIGKRFRLRATPGAGGKFQLFDHKFEAHQEPPQLTRLDTYEQYWGSAGWKTIWQMWLEYLCAGSVRISIYRDGKVLFFQKDLPAHTYRDTERFYLPSKSAGGQLNKSKSYRVVMESLDLTKPFKLYRDSSRVETIQHSGDIRAALYQNIVWPGIVLGN